MGANDLNFGFYAVAYLDILNQSSYLKAIDYFPKDEEELNKFIKQGKESYGVLLQLRKMLVDFFKMYNKPLIDISTLSEDARNTFNEMSEISIEFQGFSDCVAIYAPTAKGDGKNVNINNIYGIMTACACTMLGFLATGKCIRGGIDIGMGTIIFDKEFYGPALLRAYKLESEIAQHPRIAIGHGLLNFIHSTLQKADLNSTEGKYIHSLANTCMQMISTDYDGWPILDYLGGGFNKIVRREPKSKLVEDAYRFILEEKQRQLNRMDLKLYYRYCALQRYFDAYQAIDAKETIEAKISAPIANTPETNNEDIG